MICLKVIDTLHVSHSLVEGRHYKEDVNVTVCPVCDQDTYIRTVCVQI